jgi:hypothetical protein
VIFSVYERDTKTWSHYDGAARPPQPARGRSSRPGLGIAPEDAAPRLPLFAKKVGAGLEALGQVAEPGWQFPGVGTMVLWALAAYGLYRLARRVS